jgi:DNA-binding MarR family transcriptional regulator
MSSRNSAASDDGAEARRRLGDALAALRRIIGSQRLDRINAERSGVPIGFAAIAVLGKVIDDGPLRMSDLAEAGRIHPAALTRQVQALEAEGYIERSPDPTDGRAAVVRVTTTGRSAHRRVQQANDAIMAEQLSAWSTDELVDLVDRLEHLIIDLRTSPDARRGATEHE